MAVNRTALILTLARRLGIRDPRAALAVAAQEGLSGRIGDAGTSFGPFQLHRGGALPRTAAMLGPGGANSWAWSQPGLTYALSRIKSVAGNRTGADAIRAIVSQFERPANPGNEIQKALAYYGRSGAGGTVPSADMPLPPQNNNTLLQAVLQRQDLLPVIKEMNAPHAPMPQVPLGIQAATAGSYGNMTLPAELIYKNHFLKFGKPIAPIGGHGTHVHVAYTNPQALLHAISLANSLGLRVGENPYEGRVNPVHAKDSYHYRTFPGQYNGRRLGEAIDVTGAANLLARYYALLADRRG